jgi:hypothetical protein
MTRRAARLRVFVTVRRIPGNVIDLMRQKISMHQGASPVWNRASARAIAP